MIGRIIDKYEILEEVGQGGMSVVYKGRDTSLKREVAIKVLHPHLASHEEARRRFEREAQAVAKLRHDNILEIFDYSGKGSSDSYIVTEFINGKTLKEFVTAHKIAYPEIAAMIVAEVCRALTHAHGLGVLHRDIKPENIMVRDDGRVKLMDFGIAQVIDTARMTVTGQLLGSPAYMSPEHVEGKPLDFRTDIFSVGILLYQLATGELPFKGRNPHEILKKIAECRFLDARVVNPLVGERLGKILAKTLAREPGDRYAEVRLLADDLGRYLGEVELGDPREELGRFFTSPVPYEQALRQRLIGALTRRGKDALAAKHVGAALELFNRVLTIDPANDAVLHEIDRMSRRKRALRGAALVAGVLLVGGGALAAKLAWPGGAGASGALDATVLASVLADAGGDLPTPGDAAIALAGAADAAPDGDAGAVAVDTPADAGPARPRADAGPRIVSRTPDAGAALPGRTVRLTTSIKFGTRYSIDGAPPITIKNGSAVVELGPGAHTLVVSHDLCKDDVQRIAADDQRETISVTMNYLPRTVRFVCANATVLVNDKSAPGSIDVDFGNVDEKELKVDFLVPGQEVQSKTVKVKPGPRPLEVTCDAP